MISFFWRMISFFWRNFLKNWKTCAAASWLRLGCSWTKMGSHRQKIAAVGTGAGCNPRVEVGLFAQNGHQNGSADTRLAWDIVAKVVGSFHHQQECWQKEKTG
jgi:hypothetical protein